MTTKELKSMLPDKVIRKQVFCMNIADALYDIVFDNTRTMEKYGVELYHEEKRKWNQAKLFCERAESSLLSITKSIFTTSSTRTQDDFQHNTELFTSIISDVLEIAVTDKSGKIFQKVHNYLQEIKKEISKQEIK